MVPKQYSFVSNNCSFHTENIQTLVFLSRTSFQSVSMSILRFEYLPYGPHNWLIRGYYDVVFQKNVKLATEQAKKDGSVLDQFFFRVV